MTDQPAINCSKFTSRILRSSCLTSKPTSKYRDINISFNQAVLSNTWSSCNYSNTDRIHIIRNVWEPIIKTDRKELRSSQESGHGEYKMKHSFAEGQQKEEQQSHDNLNNGHNNFYKYWKKKALEYQEQNFKLNKQNSKLLEELEVLRFKRKKDQTFNPIILQSNSQQMKACNCYQLKAYQKQISTLQKTLQLKQKSIKQQIQKIKWLSAHLGKQNSESFTKKPNFLSQCGSELEEKNDSIDSPFERDALVSVDVSNLSRSLSTEFPKHREVSTIAINSQQLGF